MRMNNKLKVMKLTSLIMIKNQMKMMRTKLMIKMMINLKEMIKVLSKNHHNNLWRPKTML